MHSFLGNTDGSQPGALTLASDGTLYGVSHGASPYIRVFRLRPPVSPCHAVQCNWSYTTIYSFNDEDNNGAYPAQGPLAFDVSGNIYGVTSNGGNNGCNQGNNSCGTVFELSPSGGTWNLSFIHLFSGSDDPIPVPPRESSWIGSATSMGRPVWAVPRGIMVWCFSWCLPVQVGTRTSCMRSRTTTTTRAVTRKQA